jgi:molecular chaperone HtpG
MVTEEKFEQYEFQADTQQLLKLMIHSLYTKKEVFLRELISNASDALDRRRFEAIARPELLPEGERLEIRIVPDRERRCLIVQDNGAGMSREEMISCLGTVARSGTRELLKRIQEDPMSSLAPEMIGQFGVGFYSAFMVADRITVVSRRIGESTATQWESTGDGHYSVAESSRSNPGTTVTLHLKAIDSDTGIEDYTEKWILSRIVRKYSDFVSFPIVCVAERDPEDLSIVEPASTPGPMEDRVLNSMKPIWCRAAAEVKDEEFQEFYKHISHDWNEPLLRFSFQAEGRSEYRSLLYVPAHAPFDLYYHGFEFGLQLYAKRVLIVEKCHELLPRYLRFLRGVVDSADLPLNISRDSLQENRHVSVIRKWLTKKILDSLTDLMAQDYAKYLKLWAEFGRALKEGASEDIENKDRILSISLFPSSRGTDLISLAQYVEAMPEGQNEIYYLTGESRAVIENSPHLEAFRERKYEILYLTEPVDELLVQVVSQYRGKSLKCINKGKVELGTPEEREETEKRFAEETRKFAELMKSVHSTLEQSVKQVRLSKRLTSSPACLAGDEGDYSPQMERLLSTSKGGRQQRRVLELNPSHPVILKMLERFEANGADLLVKQWAVLLHGYAALAEGSPIPDPVPFTKLLPELMQLVARSWPDACIDIKPG